jgi:hypothetical protein
MASRKESKRVEPKPQLRGAALETRIEVVIREMASQARVAGEQFIYNASRTANLVPTTRKSLAKHGECVARILNELEARRRMTNGDATVEHLREQIGYLKEQIADRDKTIKGLRSHHIDIYQRFHAHSLEAELLIRPILEIESKDAGECLFCGTKVDATKQLKRPSNVVQMKDSGDD